MDISSHTMKPNTPGMHAKTLKVAPQLQLLSSLSQSCRVSSVTVPPPCSNRAILRCNRYWVTACAVCGDARSMTLWETVTTGKCLIGLIWGSNRTVQTKRMT